MGEPRPVGLHTFYPFDIAYAFLSRNTMLLYVGFRFPRLVIGVSEFQLVSWFIYAWYF